MQSETNVPTIMQKDGVEKRTFNMKNQPDSWYIMYKKVVDQCLKSITPKGKLHTK